MEGNGGLCLLFYTSVDKFIELPTYPWKRLYDKAAVVVRDSFTDKLHCLTDGPGGVVPSYVSCTDLPHQIH